MTPEQILAFSKALGLVGISLQLIALFLSSRLDFKNLTIEAAEKNLHKDIFLDAYNIAKSGKIRSITTEELNLKILQSGHSTENNRRILKYVLILIGSSLVFQLVAALIDFSLCN
jgi:hypothetical protein